MKVKGNNPTPGGGQPDANRNVVRYPEPREHPEDFTDAENEGLLENDEDNSGDGESPEPIAPPRNNVLPFRKRPRVDRAIPRPPIEGGGK